MTDIEYKPNIFLEKAVAAQDTDAVKLAFRQLISADPEFKSNRIYKAIQYAESHGIKVYEDTFREDLEIITDRSKWTKDYFAEAMVNLQYNFRPERLEHVKAVGKYLYDKPNQIKPQNDTKEEKPVHPKANRTPRRKIIIGMVIILVILVVLVLKWIE